MARRSHALETQGMSRAARTALPVEVAAAAEKGGFSAAQYNDIARSARIGDIKLAKSEFTTAPLPAAVGDEGVDAQLSFSGRVVSCRYDAESRTAAAIFRYGVKAVHVNAALFDFGAEYAVVYGMADDAHPEAATAFCKHVGYFAAYPYFRALAAQMAWNAGIALPPLPTIAAMPVVPDPIAKANAAPAKGDTDDIATSDTEASATGRKSAKRRTNKMLGAIAG